MTDLMFEMYLLYKEAQFKMPDYWSERFNEVMKKVAVTESQSINNDSKLRIAEQELAPFIHEAVGVLMERKAVMT